MRGITPVVALIVLVLITISIVGLVFTMLNRITQTTGEAAQQQAVQASTFATFKIEGVYGNQVYVRNLGKTNLSNLTFYVNGVQISSNNPVNAQLVRRG